MEYTDDQIREAISKTSSKRLGDVILTLTDVELRGRIRLLITEFKAAASPVSDFVIYSFIYKATNKTVQGVLNAMRKENLFPRQDVLLRIKEMVKYRDYSLERKEVYPIDYILANVDARIYGEDERHKYPIGLFDGDFIKMDSERYILFKQKGITCVSCGIQGFHFVKERPKGQKKYHFNLYAMSPEGYELLMTKDHIIPRSKGGKNNLSNYQPMCTVCNMKKSNDHPV